ncbi:MAG: molybdenum cofactor biosynthesis protein MoaE [Actinobacteria bacterium]|nr:molybdenum cofactor biosynthesis protein MoaE [Actinomycetota bacterium]
MRVRIRYFGALVDRASRAEETVELPDGASAGDALLDVTVRHPATAAIAPRLSLAVNLEVVPADHGLRDGDELALLPPVAGGATRILTGLREALRAEEALQAVGDPAAGGTVLFLGTVRDASQGTSVDRLEYSAYAEMAERVLREVAEEAVARWPLEAIAILHAVGNLSVGAPTVAVACSSAHRAEAFEAARYGIDEVKRRAPIWKKEHGPEGGRWVGLETEGTEA